MAEYLSVYKCDLCGNIVQVEHSGGGVLVCCGQNMTLLEPQSADSATEKHVPVVEKTEKGMKVTVGSTLHPMTEDHYIEWIEVIQCDKVQIQHLKPGDEPVAHFQVCSTCEDEPVIAREYCSVHGLWGN